MAAATNLPTSRFKTPSAWLPIAMSGLALIVVTTHLITTGAAAETDEGAAAHLWQLLMVGQMPVIGWFLLRWAAKNPRQYAVVFGSQIAAFLIAAAPVFLLGL